MKFTKSAGGVVLKPKEQILVVEQLGASWSFPKGHIEKGEKLLDAAKREVYEESGIKDLEYCKDLGSYQRYRLTDDGLGENKTIMKTIYMFLFRAKQIKLKPVDKDNPQALWIKKEQVAEKLTHPKDKQFFLSTINKI